MFRTEKNKYIIVYAVCQAWHTSCCLSIHLGKLSLCLVAGGSSVHIEPLSMAHSDECIWSQNESLIWVPMQTVDVTCTDIYSYIYISTCFYIAYNTDTLQKGCKLCPKWSNIGGLGSNCGLVAGSRAGHRWAPRPCICDGSRCGRQPSRSQMSPVSLHLWPISLSVFPTMSLPKPTCLVHFGLFCSNNYTEFNPINFHDSWPVPYEWQCEWLNCPFVHFKRVCKRS